HSAVRDSLGSRADVRNRTGNLRFTRAMLYQLSYVGVVSHPTAARRRWGLAALTACPLPGWRSRRLSTCRTAAYRTAAAQSIRRLWRCSRTQAAGLLDNHDD